MIRKILRVMREILTLNRFAQLMRRWFFTVGVLLTLTGQADGASTVNVVVTVINPNGYNCSPWRVRASGGTCSSCYTHSSIASGTRNGVVVDNNDSVWIDYDPGGSCTTASTATQSSGGAGTTTTLYFTLTVNGGAGQQTYCFHWSVYNPAPYPRSWSMKRHDNNQVVASGTTGPGATSSGTYCPSDGQKVQLDMTFYNPDGSVAGTGTIPTSSDGWYPTGGSPGTNGDQTGGGGDVGSWSNNVPSNLPWNTNGGLALDSTLRIVGEVLHEDTVQGFIDSVQVGQAIQANTAAINTGQGITHGKLDTINASVGAVNTSVSGLGTKLDTLHTDSGTLNTSLGSLGTKLDAANASLDVIEANAGGDGSYLSNLLVKANSDGALQAGIWLNTSNAVSRMDNILPSGFNGVSNAVGGFKTEAHTDGVNQLNQLNDIETSTEGVRSYIGTLIGSVNNVTTAVEAQDTKLAGIWVDTTAIKNNTADLDDYLADTRPFWNILTNQLGDIADNTNATADVSITNNVSFTNNITFTNSFSISNNVVVTNIFAPSNNVSVTVSNYWPEPETNGIISTYDGALAALPSQITGAKADLEGLAAGLVAPPAPDALSPGALSVTMVGHTWDFNPLTHLGGVFTVARALFAWLLVLGYCGLFLKDTFQAVGIAGSANQSRVPVFCTPVVGDAAMWKFRLVITVALLLAIGIFLGLACYKVATDYNWSDVLSTSPLLASGPVAVGVSLAGAFFPFDILFGLGIAYLLFKIAVAVAGLIYVSIVRALAGG